MAGRQETQSREPSSSARAAPRAAAPPVIGVGVAAGGDAALETLLAGLESLREAAVVVVGGVPCATRQRSPEALASRTQRPVHTVCDAVTIQAGAVYVAPPGAGVRLEGAALRLAPREQHEQTATPIDEFFYSLADEAKSEAIAVVLSGAGSDGALGLKAVCEAGGMTVAQSPDTADYAGMPRSAIAMGVVDHVLAPAQMGVELTRYLGHLRTLAASDGEEALREEIAAAIPEVADLLLEHTDHNFRHYKASTIVRRVSRRLHVTRASSVDEYLEKLRRDTQERGALFRDLLIGVTAFFRDPDAFECLASRALADLFGRARPGAPLRIWVPGCASGEEAYSIAMLCREKMDELAEPVEVQVFATDIDTRALDFARRGAYPAGIADELSGERLKRFFVKRARVFHVAREVRELCLFSHHNLISDPPFSRLDLISCRNLLIYLGPHLQQKLIPLFHYALRPGGYLFLGPSENISSHRELFRTIDATHRISQSKPVPAVASQSPAAREADGPHAPAAPMEPSPDLREVGRRIVLDEFSPEWAIVNEDAQIMTLSEGAAEYLQLAGGDFQNSIVKMAHVGLRVALRASLGEAIRRRRRVDHPVVSVRDGGDTRRVALTVQPMPRVGEDSGLFMVVFRGAGGEADGEGDAPPAGDNSMIDRLEHELATTRDDLETSIQDLEVANEELKSTNEELLSMNEELQSANEELETSKEEVQTGAEALSRAKSDLENLLRSTEIATLFLDDELTIRSFTPAVTEIYNLIETDVGRPLWHQTHRATDMPPLPDAETLRASSAPIEDAVQTVDGRVFSRRVMPYRKASGERAGVVVTFTDVTGLHRALDTVARRERQTAVLADLGRRALAGHDLPALLDYAAAQVSQTLGAELCKVLQLLPGGDRVLLTAGVGWDDGLLGEATVDTGMDSQAGYTLQVATPVIVEDLRTEERFRGPALLTDHGVVSGLSVVIGPHDAPWGVLGAHTRRKASFTVEDTHFIEAVANTLWEAIQHQQAEDKLRESEERFRTLADNIHQLAWMADESGWIFWYNQRWYDYTGTTLDEMQGWGWKKVHHPDHVDRVVKRVQHSWDTGEPWEDLFPLRGKDGSYRWFLSRALAIHDASGKVVRWFGTNTDVTEQRTVEEALRKAERRLRAFLDNAPSLMGIVEIPQDDSDILHTLSNAATEGYYGVGAGDTAGRWAHRDLGASKATIRRFVRQYRKAQRTGDPVRFPFAIETNRMPDGHRHEKQWLDVTVAYVGRGGAGRDKFCYTATDDTDRRKAEEASRASGERLRRAAEAAHFGTFDADFVTGHVYWSPELRRIVGLAEDAPAPVGAGELPQCVHPDDRDRAQEALQASLDPRGQGVLNDEHRIVLAGGEVRWVQVRGRTHFEGAGKRRRAARATGTMVDITERKRLENELRQLASMLSESNRRKDEFLATLAHELRNPLAPIRTGLEVMQRAQDQPAVIAEARAMMQRQVHQLITLVDDLLEVARITRGRLELRKRTITLDELARDAIEASRHMIEEARHTLTVDLPTQPVYLEADPHRLTQVLSNLLNNAAKYTPEGGRIELTARRDAGHVVITVRDNGVGIPPDMLERVFEMFAQIDHPNELGAPGLGIGLTLVKTLVELHGGSVGVESEGVDKGSAFSVRVPMCAPPDEEQENGEAAMDASSKGQDNPPPTEPRRVLVVDDNKAAAYMLSTMIRTLGHEVRSAADGREAIELAQDFLPHVVLMDIGMPRMNGYEAARHIRAQQWGRGMVLVALTGWGQDDDKRRTRDAGFDLHLTKPAEPDALEQLLARPEAGVS